MNKRVTERDLRFGVRNTASGSLAGLKILPDAPQAAHFAFTLFRPFLPVETGFD